VGDGGAVVSNDPDVAARVRALRNFGWHDQKRVSTAIGSNSRLQEFQAAILSRLLPHLDEGNLERAGIAARYREGFASGSARGAIGLPPVVAGSVHHQFAIRVDDRDTIRDRLLEAGIGTAVHYAVPLHRQPAFAGFLREELPVTESLASDLLSLPIQPEVAAPHVDEIISKVSSVIDGAARRAGTAP